ncbi:hypothetical protein FRC17_005830, partial [Serendipita sp. 399]
MLAGFPPIIEDYRIPTHWRKVWSMVLSGTGSYLGTSDPTLFARSSSEDVFEAEQHYCRLSEQATHRNMAEDFL